MRIARMLIHVCDDNDDDDDQVLKAKCACASLHARVCGCMRNRTAAPSWCSSRHVEFNKSIVVGWRGADQLSECKREKGKVKATTVAMARIG